MASKTPARSPAAVATRETPLQHSNSTKETPREYTSMNTKSPKNMLSSAPRSSGYFSQTLNPQQQQQRQNYAEPPRGLGSQRIAAAADDIDAGNNAQDAFSNLDQQYYTHSGAQSQLHDPVEQSQFSPAPHQSSVSERGQTPIGRSQSARLPSRSNGTRFHEDWDAEQRGSSILYDSDFQAGTMRRSNSFVASTSDNAQLARGNTLRKKASLRRSGSLGRSSSRRSMRAGSVRSLALQPETDPDQLHSALYCPVPTSGSPTEALAARFQGKWCAPDDLGL